MAAFADLTEHTGALVTLLGLFVTISGILVGVLAKVLMVFKGDILSRIQEVDDKIERKLDATWKEISFLKDNQAMLRAELPKEYLRIDGPGYHALLKGITRIEEHFEVFAKDCRDGKCGGVRILRREG